MWLGGELCPPCLPFLLGFWLKLEGNEKVEETFGEDGRADVYILGSSAILGRREGASMWGIKGG